VDRTSAVVDLLNIVAKLMKSDPHADPKTLQYLERLRQRVHAATSPPPADHRLLLPATPPAKWLDRKDRTESPIDFIRRDYSPWLGKGLTRADIRRLDKSLYAALTNWLSEHKKLPEDVDLPTKKQMNDRIVEQLGHVSVKLPADARELRRLYQLSRRRSGSRG
jgi:hypothetical protein